MPADPLSNVLDLLHARCGLSGRLVAGGAWGRRFTNVNAIKFVAATKGACWYFMDGLVEPVVFDAGDVLVMNGTRSLILMSDPCSIPDAVTSLLQPDGEGIYRLGQGDDFEMLSGMVQIEPERQAWLQSGLPPLIHVRGSVPEATPLAWLLEQLVREMKPEMLPGQTMAIAALCQLLFVQTLRAYMAHAPAADSGWLKGFGDSRLRAALRCIHDDPTHSWGLDELAKKAGMSRTSFAVRFRDIMGMPPLSYLTNWRMHLAKRELRAGASINEAAARVGYASESAFSGAFRRAMGVAPGHYRRTRDDKDARPRLKEDAEFGSLLPLTK
jgi:AraC-like DNA-binding protein